MLNESSTFNPHLNHSSIKVISINKEDASQFISFDNLPESFGGVFIHNQTEWKEFFINLEPLQLQCLNAGKRLVQILSDIRNSDVQGEPNRRQLHSQHRSLSRALMDTEIQNLRRKGPSTLLRLQERARRINNRLTLKETKNKKHEKEARQNENVEGKPLDMQMNPNDPNLVTANTTAQDFVKLRLNDLTTVFNEVDRVAKRLEVLTDQRRERLRELSRQRAMEEEINEVIFILLFVHDYYLAKIKQIIMSNVRVGLYRMEIQ